MSQPLDTPDSAPSQHQSASVAITTNAATDPDPDQSESNDMEASLSEGYEGVGVDRKAPLYLIEARLRKLQALQHMYTLPPTKIQRKYKCKICDTLTFNPREHLRHRQDAHGEKVKIVECPECQYACQYRQKLNRHMDLVHRKEPRVPSKVRAVSRVVATTKEEPEQPDEAWTTDEKISFNTDNQINSQLPFEVPFSFYPYWLDPLYMAEPLDLSISNKQQTPNKPVM